MFGPEKGVKNNPPVATFEVREEETLRILCKTMRGPDFVGDSQNLVLDMVESLRLPRGDME